jgi:formate dehydrogenase (coenzyme F420) beta subunit
MEELRDLARRLLSDGAVRVVIGWEEGPRGPRPTFVTTPDGAGRLVFDDRCVHSLASYLNPRRTHVRRLGKPAVVVKPSDARAIAVLLRDAQIAREDVVLIGVRCGQAPELCDFVVGPELPPQSGREALDERVREMDARSASERWAFWTGEFARCVRCYACREACPLCVCERCVADKSVPQWIESSPHVRGNLAWHVTRALHQAGRCVGCGECERACPAGIPLGLLNRKLQQSVQQRFGYVASEDPGVCSPVGTFRQEDPQEFIR